MGGENIMKHFRFSFILFILIFLTPLTSYADKTISESDCKTRLWDLSGTYDNDSLFGCDLSFTLYQDEKGKLSGGSELRYCEISYPDVGLIEVSFAYSIKGLIKQKYGIPTIKMTITNTGDAKINGSGSYPIKVIQKLTADVNSSTGQIVGTINSKMCIKGFGCDSYSDAFISQVPDGMDGTWDLSFEENGEGNLLLSNGRSIDFYTTGKFNPNKGVSSYKLKGKVSNLGIKYDENSHKLLAIKGKILGQKINYKVPKTSGKSKPMPGNWSGTGISFTVDEDSTSIKDLKVAYSGYAHGTNCSSSYSGTANYQSSISINNNSFSVSGYNNSVNGKFTNGTSVTVTYSWSYHNSYCNASDSGSRTYTATPD